jgi:hypothetical protein
MNRAQERRAWEEHFFPGSTKKQAKYKNEKVEYGGRTFDSRREAERAKELELWQKLGIISDLKYQVRFEVIPKQGKRRAAHYVADFTYMDNGRLVVEDTKGVRTRDFVLKSKLMLQVHKIAIKEVS